MEKFFGMALKVTGPVAVVGFLMGALLKFIFRKDIVALFGDEKLFVIVMVLISLLAIALITSILVFRKGPEKEQKQPQRTGNKTTISHSKIEGDVVGGDKYVNKKDKND